MFHGSDQPFVHHIHGRQEAGILVVEQAAEQILGGWVSKTPRLGPTRARQLLQVMDVVGQECINSIVDVPEHRSGGHGVYRDPCVRHPADFHPPGLPRTGTSLSAASYEIFSGISAARLFDTPSNSRWADRIRQRTGT